MHREIFDFRFPPQTGSRLFFANRKLERSAPEVDNMLDEKRIKFCCVSTILLFCYFQQGRRQRLLKNFVSNVTVYGHTRTKMIIAVTRIESSKNEDWTLITKTRELSDEIHFDFRFLSFQLPVWEKHPTSGLRSETEVENFTMHNLKVNSIHPQSFIQIGPRVSEE